MGDGIKILKDKRHRSSSSLASDVIEGTRSDRKLDIRGIRRASIPEVDDQFALAEARCDELQQKIDLVKNLKKKKKLRRRSVTKLTESVPVPENVPFITVHTQPKKKVSQQARLRRLEPGNPVRGYLDPATVEQHRMLRHVRGYQQENLPKIKQVLQDRRSAGNRQRRNFMRDPSVPLSESQSQPQQEVACGDDDAPEPDDTDHFDTRFVDFIPQRRKKSVEPVRSYVKSPSNRRIIKESTIIDGEKWPIDMTEHLEWRANTPQAGRRTATKPHRHSAQGMMEHTEERHVEELYTKASTVIQRPARPTHEHKAKGTVSTFLLQTHPVAQKFDDDIKTSHIEHQTRKKESSYHPRRPKYRSRRYEMPTVASQMKQAGARYYYGPSNHTNIPFIVSKSTAPSHNIGVNIQQVLSGLKMQQPLTGIPLTIAHHMGLGHIPSYGTKAHSGSAEISLANREINAIKLGRRLVRLPSSNKYMSYTRVLNMYREGDGMVPRFLRAISRPHYFYTSMYNSLAINREDLDGATSKGVCTTQEAKQSLAEYATLYKEYELLDKRLRAGDCNPDYERRHDELSKELLAREDHIRRVVQEYKSEDLEQGHLRASLSNAEETSRYSTSKLGHGDTQL